MSKFLKLFNSITLLVALVASPCYGELNCPAPQLSNQADDFKKIQCHLRLKTFQCETQKAKAPPAEVDLFLDCEKRDDLDFAPGSTLFACGKGLGGVLVDGVVGLIAFVPETLLKVAAGRLDLPELFKTCHEDLDAKKIRLGDLRPDEMTDENLRRMTCAEVQKFAHQKSESIIKALEKRRAAQMATLGIENLRYEELVPPMNTREVQALAHDKGFLNLSGFECLRPAVAAERICAKLTIAAQGFGAAMTLGPTVSAVRSFRSSRALAAAKEGPLFALKDSAPASAVTGEIQNIGGNPLNKKVLDKAAKNFGTTAVVTDEMDTFSMGTRALFDPNVNVIKVGTADYLAAGDLPNPVIAHEIGHASTASKVRAGRDYSYSGKIKGATNVMGYNEAVYLDELPRYFRQLKHMDQQSGGNIPNSAKYTPNRIADAAKTFVKDSRKIIAESPDRVTVAEINGQATVQIDLGSRRGMSAFGFTQITRPTHLEIPLPKTWTEKIGNASGPARQELIKQFLESRFRPIEKMADKILKSYPYARSSEIPAR